MQRYLLALVILVLASVSVATSPYFRGNDSNIQVVPVAAPAVHNRPDYAYSVVQRGVYSREEAREAAERDTLVRAHYQGIDAARLSLTSARNRSYYVSYRKNNGIYWTSKPVRVPEGEAILSDSENLIRARCGNRLSTTPQHPVAAAEPTPGELDSIVPPPQIASTKKPVGSPTPGMMIPKYATMPFDPFDEAAGLVPGSSGMGSVFNQVSPFLAAPGGSPGVNRPGVVSALESIDGSGKPVTVRPADVELGMDEHAPFVPVTNNPATIEQPLLVAVVIPGAVHSPPTSGTVPPVVSAGNISGERPGGGETVPGSSSSVGILVPPGLIQMPEPGWEGSIGSGSPESDFETPTPVAPGSDTPEPGTLSIVAVALGALAFSWRRKRTHHGM